LKHELTLPCIDLLMPCPKLPLPSDELPLNILYLIIYLDTPCSLTQQHVAGGSILDGGSRRMLPLGQGIKRQERGRSASPARRNRSSSRTGAAREGLRYWACDAVQQFCKGALPGQKVRNVLKFPSKTRWTTACTFRALRQHSRHAKQTVFSSKVLLSDLFLSHGCSDFNVQGGKHVDKWEQQQGEAKSRSCPNFLCVIIVSCVVEKKIEWRNWATCTRILLVQVEEFRLLFALLLLPKLKMLDVYCHKALVNGYFKLITYYT